MIDSAPLQVIVIGRGRAGGSFARALADVGCVVTHVPGRDPSGHTFETADLVLLCVPDDAIELVASALPATAGVVAHVSGATTLAPLAPHHERVASIHPLLSLPSPERGAELLRTGATFAVAGDSLARDIVEMLDGHAVAVDDDQRAAYHAAASMAANHLVALIGQVEHVADLVGVPVDAYLDLMQGALDASRAHGAAAALTGPVARGDWHTVRGHLAALPVAEQAAYRAMARRAADLAGQTWPSDME